MKRKFSTVVVSSLIFLIFIGFNMMDTKPKMIFDDPSSVAPGNTLDLNNSNFSDKTYNDQGSIIYNTDNSLAYLEEGFESTTFPPPGWVRVNITGTLEWQRSTAFPRTGVADALMDYQITGGEDWLITPQFNVTAGDSMIFWLALRFVNFPPDSLAIRISTTTQLPADITTYPTRLLYIADGSGYPTVVNVYQRYAVSLNAFAGQNIYIAFRHGDLDGDGIRIDDVSIGTPPPNDVGTVSIDISNPSPVGNQAPKVTVKNFGSVAQTFPVTMTISGGYSDQQTVTNLAPGATQQVTFANWNAAPGSHLVTVYTQLVGDVNPNNDTLRTTIRIFANTANCGWTFQTPMPTPRGTSANAFWRAGTSPNDTGFLYVIGGANPTFTGFTTENKRFNTRTNTWTDAAPIPLSRYHAQAVTARNKIYVMGGYNPNFTALNRNDIYDPISNTWSTGTPLPTAVGDFAIGVYRDSLIYAIAGYGGTDFNIVQIYNVVLNTWTTGTSKPGAPCAAIRGGIHGNKIVVAGGYNQLQGASFDSAYVGTIDPSNSSLISWSANVKYPGGAIARLGAGVPYNSNPSFPYVFFTGGDSTSTGATATDRTWGYNVNTNAWTIVPSKPTKSNNINSFVGVIRSDSLFMVNAGGWNGSAATTVNEWLCLGSALSSTLTLTINLEACNETDAITVELRSVTSPFALVESQVGLGGQSIPRTFQFANAVNGTSYYIVVKHRNSIETWSKLGGEMFTGGALSYDFTSLQTQAFGGNMVNVGGEWSFYTGDVNQDGIVDGADAALIDNDAFNFVTGYVDTDLNCDDVVDGSDAAFADNNVFNFVQVIRP